MANQIKDVIDIYLNEEVITRLSIEQIKTLPKISIGKDFSNSKKMSILNESFDDLFLKKLLNQNEFEKFDKYFDKRNILLSCKLYIKSQQIDCPKPELMLRISPILNMEYFLFGDLNDSYKDLLIKMNAKHDLQSVILELSTIYENFTET